MIGLSGKKSVNRIKIKIIGKSKVSITSTELEELLVRMIKEIDSGLCRFR